MTGFVDPADAPGAVGAHFPPSCGELPPIRCPHCPTEISFPENDLCPNCGGRLGVQEHKPAPPAPGPALEEMAERLRERISRGEGAWLNAFEAREVLSQLLPHLPLAAVAEALSAVSAVLARLAPRSPAGPADPWIPDGDWTPNAVTIAAMEDARASRTEPVTLDELRTEIDAGPTFGPKLEEALRDFDAASFASALPAETEDAFRRGHHKAEHAEEALRRAIRAEVDAARPGLAGAVRAYLAARDEFDALEDWPSDDDPAQAGEVETFRAAEIQARLKLGLARDALEAFLFEDSRVSFQARNAAWMAEVFAGDPTDTAERVHRFLEEGLELTQSLGQTAAEAHALVDYVHGRPKGEPAQEVGGTMTTLALLCAHVGIDMAAAGEAELARCSTPEIVAKIREKRAKRHGRGPLPGTYAPDFVPGQAADGGADGWCFDMGRAPRDGTSILTLDADGGMYVVDWCETLGNGVPVTSGHCWWGTEGSGKYGFHTSAFVAWRPLPPPPAQPGREG